MVGDGGLMLNPGEFATAVQGKADFILLLMNEQRLWGHQEHSECAVHLTTTCVHSFLIQGSSAAARNGEPMGPTSSSPDTASHKLPTAKRG
jgi:hypothetical protein